MIFPRSILWALRSRSPPPRSGWPTCARARSPSCAAQGPCRSARSGPGRCPCPCSRGPPHRLPLLEPLPPDVWPGAAGRWRCPTGTSPSRSLPPDIATHGYDFGIGAGFRFPEEVRGRLLAFPGKVLPHPAQTFHFCSSVGDVDSACFAEIGQAAAVQQAKIGMIYRDCNPLRRQLAYLSGRRRKSGVAWFGGIIWLETTY